MIAIDLSPLVLDPLRGVSRALLHLLAGLRQVPRGDLRIEGFLPVLAIDDPDPRPLCAGLEEVHVLPVPPRPRQVWKRALRRAVDLRRARVMLTPWAAFPKVEAPVVAWIHEVPFARHGALEGTLRTLRHRRALARAVDLARALVVPSEAVRADLVHLHPEAHRKIHLIAHGFDPTPWRMEAVEVTLFDRPTRVEFEVGPSAVAKFMRTGLIPVERPPPRHSYVLLVGTGHGAGGARKKGLDVFVQACAGGTIAGLTPVVVGTASNLPAHVRVIPDAADLALWKLMADARVLVVPSRSEGFGYPMLEAFAAGVPVVASAAGALPEVSGGAARLVPPGDPDALAEAIARVATDEDLRARMIADGKKRAREFPVEAMAKGWLRVLCQAGGLPCPV